MKPLSFNNTFTSLPETIFTRTKPTPVKQPSLISINTRLAIDLGISLEWLESKNGIDTIAGNHILKESDPISTVYAGHQFGVYNPQLGDGRAILIGEILSRDGERFDVQLKGSGRTIYSRGGDGRSALGPVLREYLISEAMHALGIPTTRSLAAVLTGENVIREDLLPGAILTRIARSHIRIGTFQYVASTDDIKTLSTLTNYVLKRHYPETESDNAALALLKNVVKSHARLIAQWQLIGFIHGVMNTDNSLLCGETVDYGPCAFLDSYNPNTVFSSIDHGGRYCYRNQPGIAHWNLTMLAQSLLPLIDKDTNIAVEQAQQAVNAFPTYFSQFHNSGLAKKLGLKKLEKSDEKMVNSLFQIMSENNLDFTLTFRYLSDSLNEYSSPPKIKVPDEVKTALTGWIPKWLARLSDQTIEKITSQNLMYQANPAYIPRNHLVELAIKEATERQDYAIFESMNQILSNPFEYNPKQSLYAEPPRPEQVVKQTFCGT